MATKICFIKTCGDIVSRSQDQALVTTIYILREYGPTGFLLKEEQEEKNFKIFLGQEHTCSCPAFQKTKELCKHICWLLLKKFRVSRNAPLSWQKGLNEREINELLYNQTSNINANNSEATSTPSQEAAGLEETREITDGCVEQRAIDDESVCPICLDNLLKSHQPVTYCRYGCGNSIHIKCMRIHAVHQKTNEKETITCPMCRANFVSLETLKKEERNSMNGVSRPVKNYHYGVTCEACHLTPIVGNCYKCTSCESYYLCQTCFNMPIHQEHSFKFRQRKIQKWRSAFRNFGYALPNAMVNNLMGRELKTEDYDTLLQLDSENTQEFTSLPEKVIDSLPLETVAERSSLLAQGAQCYVCLQPFHLYQPVRKLPCHHKFHRECIDNWLLHCHAVCPVDGQEVWNPYTATKKKCKTKLKKKEECLPKDTLALDITGCSIEPSQPKKPVLGQLRMQKSFQADALRNKQRRQDFLLNGTSVLSGQSQSNIPGEDVVASISNKEAGDYFQFKTNSLLNVVSQKSSGEAVSSADRIDGERQASSEELIAQCQPNIERVKSAPFLRLMTNILPPIQVKEKMPELRQRKISKHPSDDVSQFLFERCPLQRKFGKIRSKASKSNQLQRPNSKDVNLEMSKQRKIQHLFLEGYEINLKQ